MTYVELSGVIFSGGYEPSDGLIYSTLIGWDGQPEGRGAGDAIPGAHGSFDRVNAWRESRAISIEAAIIAESREEFFAVKRRIEALPATGVMRVDQGDGAWSRRVEIDRISIPDWHDRTSTKFTIDLIAPDPVRYGLVTVSGPTGLPVQDGGLSFPAAFNWNFGTLVHDVAVVVNDGELPVLPRIVIDSSVPDGTVSADSITIFAGPYRLEFGAFSGRLVFDARERRAWLDGVDVTRRIVRREWPSIGPGEAHEFYFDAVGASPNISLLVEYQIGVW